MILLPLLFGCERPPTVSPPAEGGPRYLSMSWTVAPDAEGDGPTCPLPRDEDYAQWPGGQRMRLTLGRTDSTDDDEVPVTVTGARPGARIEIRVGALCALDCPDLDGGCFQPGASELLAELVADGQGAASGSVRNPGGRGWWVMQAAAPDPLDRAVSQPIVDYTGAEFPGSPWPPNVARVTVAPATIRRVSGLVGPAYDWPVAAGRRAQLHVETVAGSYFYDVPPGVSVTHLGATEFVGVPIGSWVAERTFAEASRWLVDLFFNTDQAYDLDLVLLPTETARRWYPDADGDGYGDPTQLATLSSTPVPGASADERDCDDADPSRHPLGAETCGDGVDDDCDGADRPCTPAPGDALGAAGTRILGPPYHGLGWSVTLPQADDDAPDELATIGFDATGAVLDVDRTDLAPSAVARMAYTLASSGPVDGGPSDLAGSWWGSLWIDRVSPDGPPLRLVTATTPVTAVAVVDVTGDGRDDVLAEVMGGGIAVFDPTAAALPTSAQVVDGASADGADVDGDGTADLLDGTGCVWHGPPPFARGTCTAMKAGVLGDADGDGAADVIGVWNGEVAVVRSPADGGLPWATLDLELPGPQQRALTWVADRTEAHPAWLAATAYSGQDVVAMRIDGPGRWTEEDRQSWPATALLAGDLDGDGALDLVLTDPYASYEDRPEVGAVWVLWSAGAW